MNIADRMRHLLLEVGVAPLLYILVALLVATIGLGVERALFFASTREPLGRFALRLTALLHGYHLVGARKLAASSRSAEAAVVSAGLRQYERGAGAASEAMAGAVAMQRLRLERRLWLFRALGWGGLFVGATASLVGSLEGGRELVPLAFGLSVAAAAFAASSYFQSCVAVSLGNAQALSHLLLSALEGGNLALLPSDDRDVAERERGSIAETDDYDAVPSSA